MSIIAWGVAFTMQQQYQRLSKSRTKYAWITALKYRPKKNPRLYFTEIKPLGLIHIQSLVTSRALGLYNPALMAVGKSCFITGQLCDEGLNTVCWADLYLAACPVCTVKPELPILVWSIGKLGHRACLTVPDPVQDGMCCHVRWLMHADYWYTLWNQTTICHHCRGLCNTTEVWMVCMFLYKWPNFILHCCPLPAHTTHWFALLCLKIDTYTFNEYKQHCPHTTMHTWCWHEPLAIHPLEGSTTTVSSTPTACQAIWCQLKTYFWFSVVWRHILSVIIERGYKR